jgi:predicted nuclease of predicted toxin-antitoxin system
MLNSVGYDAIHVGELGLSSAEDADILAIAQASNRVLVSADTDFAALLALRGANSPSVILFRTKSRRSAQQQFVLLRDLLPLFEKDLMSGSILVISENRVRVRRLPLLAD